jgi:L-fuconolactonase
MPSFPIIDSHVHLYDPGALSFPWMKEAPALLKPHLLPDFDRARGPVEVEKLVFVEVDVEPSQRIAEARWVETQAEADPRIAAIVASAPLEEGEAAREILDRLAETQRVRGIRRLIQGEPDPEFCLRPGFVEGVRLLSDYGFSFDICVRHHQLASAIGLVRLCPDVPFILDHIAKPAIRDGLFDPWRAELAELAALPNVTCKISGVATEADHEAWTRDQLRPYIDHALACFGFERAMFGSDWPVLNLASRYTEWVELLDEAIAGTSEAEQRAFYRDTAARVYRL